MNTDHIVVDDQNRPRSFVGKDAVEIFRVRALRSSIELHRKCGMIPTRGVTITKMLAMASAISGKKYKRGAHAAAVADLDLWLSAAECSIPLVDERGRTV